LHSNTLTADIAKLFGKRSNSVQRCLFD